MTNAELAVASALGASFLTGLASLGVIALRQWLHQRAERIAVQVEAVTTILARSHALIHRTEIVGQTIMQRSGANEALDITLHHRAPLDLMSVWDWLGQDYQPMTESLSRLWVLGDRDLVRLANDVVVASAKLTRMWGDIRQPSGLLGRLRQANWSPADRERWTNEVEKLGKLRNDLAVEARKRLGGDAFEPWMQHTGLESRPVRDSEVHPTAETWSEVPNGES